MRSAMVTRILHGTQIHTCRPEARRAKLRVLVSCQSNHAGRQQQLAAAALLSAVGLHCIVPPAYAIATLPRVQTEHRLSIKRALLEDLLMKEMGTRLKSLSDEDLMMVLEQVHSGAFPLSLAAPSLHDTPDDDTILASPSVRPSAVPSTPPATPDTDSPIDRQATHGLASSSRKAATGDRQSADSPSIPTPLADGQLPESSEQAQQGEIVSRKLPGNVEEGQDKSSAGRSPGSADIGQKAKAAAGSFPDAWQHQSYRLQAFIRPLMQSFQGPTSLSPSSTARSEPQQPQTSTGQTPSSISSPLRQHPSSGSDSSSNQQRAERETQQAEAPALAPADQQGIPTQPSTADPAGPSSGELTREGGADDSGRAAPGPKGVGSREQPTDQGNERASLNSKVQVGDEAEDATSKMLQSAGVPLPLPLLAPSQSASANGAPAQTIQGDRIRDPSVASYLGAIWGRTAPQLMLLSLAASVSTLIGGLAESTAARSRSQAPARPEQRQAEQVSLYDASQNERSLTGGPAVAHAVWIRLSNILGRNGTGANKDRGQSQPADSPQAATQHRELSHDAAGASLSAEAQPQHQLHANSTGGENGIQNIPLHDEWGRAILQFRASGRNHTQASGVLNGETQGLSSTNAAEQEAAGSPGAILWVRKDPEEQQGADAAHSAASPTILWRRDHANEHVREKGTEETAVPVRLRRSRLRRHDVSVESLLDNVE